MGWSPEMTWAGPASGPSAQSGDVLGDRQVIAQGRGEGGTDPLLHLARGEQPGGLHDASLAVDPLRLDRVEPRALDRQPAGHDAHPTVAVGTLVVRPQPAPDRGAAVPAGVVPDQDQ